MPSKTPKQRRYMRMCASTKGRKKAKGQCPPQNVAKEYVKADKRKARRRK